VTILFVFAGPETIFVVFSGKLLARHPDWAGCAQHVGPCLTTFAGLRALGFLGKEQFETAFAHCEFLPSDVAGEIVNRLENEGFSSTHTSFNTK